MNYRAIIVCIIFYLFLLLMFLTITEFNTERLAFDLLFFNGALAAIGFYLWASKKLIEWAWGNK